MRDKIVHRGLVLSSAVALVGWSFVSPRLPTVWRVPLQAGVGTLLVLVTRAPLGLRPPRLWAGLRLGSAAGATALGVIAAATLLPPVRASMAGRQQPAPAPVWLLWYIPVGTVWAEESAFRAALATAGSEAFGEAGGRLLQAATFGLTHIVDARAGNDSVPAIVLVTGVGGWLFGLFAERSGSLLAPMLVHLAINEAGALVALALRRRPAPVTG